MEQRKFGKTDMNVSVLGFGGAEIGFSGATRDRVEELLSDALDAGLNVIDTAECYEKSEELIGETVSGRRKDFYLFTKCGHSKGWSEGGDWNDTKKLEESLDRSLKRLKTGHVDLFQLHSCSLETLQKGTVVEFMKRAKQSGKARFIGYSGDNEAALYAVNSGVFDALQISASIADQWAIDVIIPAAVRKEMGIIVKRPIANAVWRHDKVPDPYYAEYWKRIKVLDYDFLRNRNGGGTATALRFTLAIPGISTAIVGTQKPGRWQENARVVSDGPLDPKIYESIRKRWKQIAPGDWLGET